MTQPDLITSTDLHGETATVTVQGEVDLVTCLELRHTLDEALQTSACVVLDLEGLSFIDSSGLNVLVEAHRKARDAGGTFVLRDPSPMLRRLLDITKLDTLLTVESSPAAPGDQG